MTETFGVGRSFSFAPNSPQEPCEADEYKHDLTKVVERDVHLASLLPEGGAAVAQPPKEFHLSQERKKRPSAWREGGPRSVYGRLSRGIPAGAL